MHLRPFVPNATFPKTLSSATGRTPREQDPRRGKRLRTQQQTCYVQRETTPLTPLTLRSETNTCARQLRALRSIGTLAQRAPNSSFSVTRSVFDRRNCTAKTRPRRSQDTTENQPRHNRDTIKTHPIHNPCTTNTLPKHKQDTTTPYTRHN